MRRFTKKNIEKLTGRIVKRGARVITDRLGCFNAVADAGCVHEAIVTGSGRKAGRHARFKAVNTVLGNIKSAIVATFRSGSKKHAPRRPTPSLHSSTAAMIFPQWDPASAVSLSEPQDRS